MWSPIFAFGIVLLSVYQVGCSPKGRHRFTWPTTPTTTELYEWQYPYKNIRPEITSSECQTPTKPWTPPSPPSSPSNPSNAISGDNHHPHHHGKTHHKNGHPPHAPPFRHSCPPDFPRPLQRAPKAPSQNRFSLWCGRGPNHKKGKKKKDKKHKKGKESSSCIGACDRVCEQTFPQDNGYLSEDEDYDNSVYTF